MSPRRAASSPRPARRPRRGDPAPYDFRRPIQLSREHQRHLQLAFDGFARQATTVFTSALRTVCQVTTRSIEQRSYAEFVESLARTTYLTTFSADPVPGTGVMDLPLLAVMSCVDHMLGGPGGDDQPQRALTEIESGVVEGLVRRLLESLRYGLGEIVAVEPAVVGVEYSPQFAQVAGPADVMVVIGLDLRIDEREHPLTFCLPFNGLLPHLAAAAAPAPVSARERSQRAQAAELVDRQFQMVPVEVAVRLRTTRLAADTFDGLRPGDVVRLGHPASAPLDVRVDDTLFAHATAGTRGPRLAALIVATPEETP